MEYDHGETASCLWYWVKEEKLKGDRKEGDNVVTCFLYWDPGRTSAWDQDVAALIQSHRSFPKQLLQWPKPWCFTQSSFTQQNVLVSIWQATMMAFESHKPFPRHPSDSDLVSFPLCTVLVSLHESAVWERAHLHTAVAQGAESPTPALQGSITELSEEALWFSCCGLQSPLHHDPLEEACCWNHLHVLLSQEAEPQASYQGVIPFHLAVPLTQCPGNTFTCTHRAEQ